MFHSCPDLTVNLDLRGLNLSFAAIVFRDCGNLRVEGVVLDNRYEEREKLRMKFARLKSLTFSGVHVDTALQVISVP